MEMFVVLLLLYLQCIQHGLTENPCAARAITNQSVVCVCNSTYCDEIVREQPFEGQFFVYTSSKEGSRFKKTVGQLEDARSENEHTFTIDTSVKYQSIEGFGGAVTDAAAMNWKNLSSALQESLIQSYFGDKGIEYNMLRVPIGGCDFSTHPYAYNELPENDTLLSNFTLSIEDTMYKIPMIKRIMEVSEAPIDIVASVWSPPVWMKSNHNITGISYLLEEYYQTFAEYIMKFLEEYYKECIPVWGVTTTNEPQNGRGQPIPFNTLGWSPKDMGKWLVENLAPTVRKSKFTNLKILTMDDQRISIPVWLKELLAIPGVLEAIDGVAVHWYYDYLRIYMPGTLLSDIPKNHGKFVLGTEACTGSDNNSPEPKVFLGSWDRAKQYIVDILEDLNYDVVGWQDWNLCLDAQGGPNWVQNYVDSPVIVMPENDEFIKQPMFYAMGHVSKFIPRCSKRVKVTEDKDNPLHVNGIDNVAVLTSDFRTVVMVLYNDGKERTVAVKLGDKQATLQLKAESITTVELPYTWKDYDDYECEFESLL